MWIPKDVNKNKSELQAQEAAQVSYIEQSRESSLASALDVLSRFGGFNFLESTVDGIQNLNPERKARKKIFLTDEQKQEERDALKNKINMWIDLLNSSTAVTEMIATSKAKSEAAAAHLAKSKLVAVQSVRNLEQAYRGVMLFYKNTEADKVSNVTIVNASKEQLTDLDNPRFIDFVARELKQNYDKLDLRRQPYAVVLFDEIEKAHSSVYDIFLQIMDEGKLHDRLGKEGDFSNSIVLFTSNVGSEWLTKQINEGKNPSTTDLMEIMGSYFRPEFLARLSEIVPFSPINETMLVRIFEIQLKGVIALLDKQHIGIEITEKAKNLLAARGFTPKYGARQVAGTIRNYIRRPISKIIVAGTLTAGNTVVVDVADNGEIDWNVK